MPIDPSRPATSGPERTLRVLERVAATDEPASHTQLANELGIAKSTLSALLRNLEELGYLDAVTNGYAPGPRLLALCHRLAPRALLDDALRHRMRPVLEALASVTDETVVLSVEVGGSETRPGVVLAIDHVESPNPLRFVPPIGQPQPMYRTAAGRVFLAFTDRTASSLTTDAFPRPAGSTLADPLVIDAELAGVRQRGFAVNADETVTTIAAPVLDHAGHPVAAISVFGPTQRLPDATGTVWPHLRRILQENARSPLD